MDFKSHLLRAQRNKDFLLKDLVKILGKCPDWVTIVAFYTALHFIEAFLSRNYGLDFEIHEKRHSFISQIIPKKIFSAYCRLYDLGFSARYESVKDAPSCDEADSAVRFDLADVEQFVMSKI